MQEEVTIGEYFISIKPKVEMEEEGSNQEQKKEQPHDSDHYQNNDATLRRRRREEDEADLGQSPENVKVNKPRRRKKRDENLACSKFIAFLMVSPTIIYFFSVLYDIISRYTVTGQLLHIAALSIGFLVAVGLCALLYKPLKPFIKYVGMASLFVFFIPSIQVFNCSPLPLDNSKIGTLVRLNEGIDGFVKIAYQNSSCWRSQYFKTPFELSIYSPNLKITVKPYQVINLGMQHFDQKEDAEDGPPPEVLPFSLYLLTSPRSVKRQMYYLNLLIMVAGKARGIADVLEMSVDDRENVTLHLTGSLKKLGVEFNETKAELEEMEYLVRPAIFHVYGIEVFGMPEKKDSGDDDDDDGGSRKERKKNDYKNDGDSNDDNK